MTWLTKFSSKMWYTVAAISFAGSAVALDYRSDANSELSEIQKLEKTKELVVQQENLEGKIDACKSLAFWIGINGVMALVGGLYISAAGKKKRN